jgi:hypothetical protein
MLSASTELTDTVVVNEVPALPDVDFGPLDPGMPISVVDAVYSWSNYSLWTA